MGAPPPVSALNLSWETAKKSALSSCSYGTLLPVHKANQTPGTPQQSEAATGQAVGKNACHLALLRVALAADELFDAAVGFVVRHLNRRMF